MLRGIGAQKSYTESKMQKGQWFLPSGGVPPFLEPKNITNQQSYKETFVQKKEVVFCFFPGYPDFLASTFLKTKYHNAGTGSMLRGVQRYDNDPEFLVYTVLKNNNMVLLQGLC